MVKKETVFQKELKDEIRTMFPGAIVSKLDPNDIQGIPDLLIIYKEKWAILEVKRDKNSSHRPNQEYYVDMLNGWSFSAFIYPENKEEVLDGLQRSFES